MKERLLRTLLIAFFCCSFISVFAQKFGGGITFGGVSSQVAGDRHSGFKKAGVTGGFYVNLEIGNHSLLQMELTFMQKGSRYNMSDDAVVSDDENPPYLLRLSYISLPLIYQYQMKRFMFEGGLNVDFLVGHYEEISFEENTLDDWRFINFATVFGIRYFITERVSVGLRTINSINSIRKHAVEGNVKRYSNKYGAFNDVLQFSVFYTL
ncbi:MAG: PorT family protein [Lentimicrobiaceae bacterium]|jgi:hypothetical protein|nr:PorT family protein [Lentimicrobiaceae bacterium]